MGRIYRNTGPKQRDWVAGCVMGYDGESWSSGTGNDWCVLEPELGTDCLQERGQRGCHGCVFMFSHLSDGVYGGLVLKAFFVCTSKRESKTKQCLL